MSDKTNTTCDALLCLDKMLTAKDADDYPSEWAAEVLAKGCERGVCEWQPIETAPKGSGEDGPDDVRHPDYIGPPRLLLLVGGLVEVGAYDWYYHPGYGMGANERDTPWVHSGDDLAPTHWMQLPDKPKRLKEVTA